MKWLRDKVKWLRLTTMSYFLSKKEQESVVFVKEAFLHKKIQKYKDVSVYSDHKLTNTEEESDKHDGIWRLVKAIR